MPRVGAAGALATICGLIAACTLTTPLDELGSGGSSASTITSASGAGGSAGPGTGGTNEVGIQLVATAINHHRIDLVWDPQGASDTFDVEQDGVVIRPALSATSFQSSGLEPSTLYVYRVRATGAAGGDGWSLPASATTAPEPTGSYAEQILADQPRAFWRMEETTGVVVSDTTGTVAPGLANGADPNVVGQVGSGMGFDDGQTVSLGPVHTAESDWGWTWELWANVLAVTQPGSGLLGCSNTPRWTLEMDGEISVGMMRRSDSFTFTGGHGGVLLPFDSWHHLVVTVAGSITDNPTSKLYLDGVLLTVHDYDWAVHSPWSRGKGGQNFDGDLCLNIRDDVFAVQATYDEVAAYDYVLSATQIKRHYDAGAGG